MYWNDFDYQVLGAGGLRQAANAGKPDSVCQAARQGERAIDCCRTKSLCLWMTAFVARSVRPLVADCVEKLHFRSHSKNCRPLAASRVLAHGGRHDLLLHATKSVLIGPRTIPRGNCRLQCTLRRNRSECILEFFNTIDQERTADRPRPIDAVGMPITEHPPHRSRRARFTHRAPTLGE